MLAQRLAKRALELVDVPSVSREERGITRTVRSPEASPDSVPPGPLRVTVTCVRLGTHALTPAPTQTGPTTIVRLAEHDGELLHWFYDQGLVPGS